MVTFLGGNFPKGEIFGENFFLGENSRSEGDFLKKAIFLKRFFLVTGEGGDGIRLGRKFSPAW